MRVSPSCVTKSKQQNRRPAFLPVLYIVKYWFLAAYVFLVSASHIRCVDLIVVMGKPYAHEMEALPATYEWALKADIQILQDAIKNTASGPLVCSGSGGSLSAAYLSAALHQSLTGFIAKAATPLEIASWKHSLANLSFMIFSAGGRNTDILGIFKHLIKEEPNHLVSLTARKSSPLGNLAKKYQFVDSYSFNLPSGKDGFLATNSLLAFATLITRAYLEIFKPKEALPGDLAKLLGVSNQFDAYLKTLGEMCQPLWKRPNLIVLYSPNLQAAAFDIESKFTEAALGTVQIADYRHFAHGRHHWLAKRADTSAVLALIDETDIQIAEGTLNLLPAEVPVGRLHFKGTMFETSLAALVSSICVASSVGVERNIDPGRPGVPTFGRKIYHLNGFKDRKSAKNINRVSMVAIQRKLGVKAVLVENEYVAIWQDHFEKFRRKILQARFGAVVFDYDGTLISGVQRFSGLDDTIKKCLSRFLKSGIAVGIATGRGESVKNDLRKSFPKRLWNKIFVAYHNGAEIGRVSDSANAASEALPGKMYELGELLTTEQRITSKAAVKVNTDQISIIPINAYEGYAMWRILNELVHQSNFRHFDVKCSSHSIDILPVGVTKLSILRAIKTQSGWNPNCEILCIGDRGQWPGNDCELLSHEFSLSVHTVSNNPKSCWNLASPGARGPQAVLEYCNNLTLEKAAFRFKEELFEGT